MGIDKGKYGPMEEDLFAEMCTRKNGVTAMEAFDITKDGAREAKRPRDEKKNKKWKPDCMPKACHQDAVSYTHLTLPTKA